MPRPSLRRRRQRPRPLHQQIDPGKILEAQQLGRCERGLRWPTASDDHDLAHLALRELLERVLGDVGAREGVGARHEHARDVEGDVSVAEDDGALMRQVECAAGVVGVAVVPGHELGGGVAAWQVLAVDSERPVAHRADRIDHGVVSLLQLLEHHIGADLDVEEQPEVLAPHRTSESG